jgi:hypothetical protein
MNKRYFFCLILIPLIVTLDYNRSICQPKNPLPKESINIRILIHLIRDLTPGEIDTTFYKMGFEYYKTDSAIIRGTQSSRRVISYRNKEGQRLAVSVEHGSIHSVIYYYIDFSRFLDETKSLGYSFVSVQNVDGNSNTIYTNYTNMIVFTQIGQNDSLYTVLVSKVP